MSNLIPVVPTRAATAAVLKCLRAEHERHNADWTQEQMRLYELVRDHPRITNEQIERELGPVGLIGLMVDSGLLVSEGFSNWPNEQRLLSVAAPWVETIRQQRNWFDWGVWTTVQRFPLPHVPEDDDVWEPERTWFTP